MVDYGNGFATLGKISIHEIPRWLEIFRGIQLDSGNVVVNKPEDIEAANKIPREVLADCGIHNISIPSTEQPWAILQGHVPRSDEQKKYIMREVMKHLLLAQKVAA